MSRLQDNNETSTVTPNACRGSKVMTTPWHAVEPDPWHGVEPDPWHGVEPDPWHGVEPDPWHGVEPDPWHGVEPDPWHGVENYRGFTFRYCQDVTNPGKVRIYIERQPDYRGRLTNSHATHRLFSGEGAPPHICIKAIYLPDTFEQAQVLAHRWADATENYIRTGEFN